MKIFGLNIMTDKQLKNTYYQQQLIDYTKAYKIPKVTKEIITLNVDFAISEDEYQYIYSKDDVENMIKESNIHKIADAIIPYIQIKEERGTVNNEHIFKSTLRIVGKDIK